MRAEFHDRYLPLVTDCKTPGEAALKAQQGAVPRLQGRPTTRDGSAPTSARRSRSRRGWRPAPACRSCWSRPAARWACRRGWRGSRRGRAGAATTPGSRSGTTAGTSSAPPSPTTRASITPGSSATPPRRSRASPRTRSTPSPIGAPATYFPLVWNRIATGSTPRTLPTATRRGRRPRRRPRLMVEVREGGDRVEADVTTLDRATGTDRPARQEPRPAGRHEPPPLPAPRRPASASWSSPATATDAPHASRPSRATRSSASTSTARPRRRDREASSPPILADRFGPDDAKRDAAREAPGRAALGSTRCASSPGTAYKASPPHEPLRKEFDAKTGHDQGPQEPLPLAVTSARSRADGWALVIAMHGGGGAPKAVNDQQWQSMFERYYKDHPEAGGYVYLALRAPNDAWNGFYDDAICPLVERLIRQFVLFGDVNPDRVYILGRLARRLRRVRDRPEDARPVRGDPRLGLGPDAGRDAGARTSATSASPSWSARRTPPTAAPIAARNSRRSSTAGGPRSAAIPGGFEWKPGVGHSVPDRDKVADLLRSGPRNPRPVEGRLGPVRRRLEALLLDRGPRAG